MMPAAVAGQDCGFTQARPGEAEIVVIAVCMQAARIRSGQIAAQGLWRREVELRSCHGRKHPCWNQAGCPLRHRVRENLKRVTQCRAAAVEIEIAVVRQIAERIPVAFRLVIQPQRHAVHAVGHRKRASCRDSPLAVGRGALSGEVRPAVLPRPRHTCQGHACRPCRWLTPSF